MIIVTANIGLLSFRNDQAFPTSRRLVSAKKTVKLTLFYEKEPRRYKMKYWEIIADNLSKAGLSLGWVSAVDSNGRTIWIVDAHRDDGKRFVVRADEKLTPFLELETAVRMSGWACIKNQARPN